MFGECCDPIVGISPPDSLQGEMILGIDLGGGGGDCPTHLLLVSLLVNIVCVIQRTGTSYLVSVVEIIKILKCSCRTEKN